MNKLTLTEISLACQQLEVAELVTLKDYLWHICNDKERAAKEQLARDLKALEHKQSVDALNFDPVN